MAYSIDDFQRDLAAQLAWLEQAIVRLKKENDRLREENRELREEVTVARLFQDLEPMSSSGIGLPSTVPPPAFEFYRLLPHTFTFEEFFHMAAATGVSQEQAKEHLLLLLRDRYLIQQGESLSKQQRSAPPVRVA